MVVLLPCFFAWKQVHLFANNRINIVTLYGTSQFVPDVTTRHGRDGPWNEIDLISDCVLSILPFDSREGSVVTEFLLDIVRGTSTDFEGMLQNAINDKQFGNAVVESFSEVKGLFWKSMEKRPLSPHICLFVCLGF